MIKSKGQKIALCMNLDDYYEHGIARGVVKYAKQKPEWRLYGYGWMFRPVEDLEFWRGDGIIARVESAEDAKRLAALEIPVVDVAGAYTWTSFDQVNNDDYATGVRAGNYLLSCGFKRFAYCGVGDTGWSAERLSGFRDAVYERTDEVAVFHESLPWWERLENSEHLGEWLVELSRPVGIFACNDTAGVKLTEVCRKLMIDVPEEAAIIGVDNEDILCELSQPSLSSIELDCGQIGFKAARHLDEVLNGETTGLNGPVLVSPLDLIERESTRVFAGDDPLVKQAVEFIRARGIEGIQVQDVLNNVAASRRSLEIRFKAAMGRTLHDEIARVRLDHAKILLRTTNLTVSNVANESGFGTMQRFHSQFKEWCGMSPGAYRKQGGSV
ncbi:MAG: DNA-binding transcriptional regulator [Spirochaetales bacterium]|jgi:LacI family transcriptional regulator|nr:DNA-binding transcriptional regulator [Spirochaetales bacterium]